MHTVHQTQHRQNNHIQQHQLACVFRPQNQNIDKNSLGFKMKKISFATKNVLLPIDSFCNRSSLLQSLWLPIDNLCNRSSLLPQLQYLQTASACNRSSLLQYLQLPIDSFCCPSILDNIVRQINLSNRLEEKTKTQAFLMQSLVLRSRSCTKPRCFLREPEPSLFVGNGSNYHESNNTSLLSLDNNCNFLKTCMT